MLKIDLSTCTKCGNCARVCPAFVIEIEDGGPVEKYPENCIECGHCVAVCPVNAVVHERMDPAGFPAVEDPGITLDAFNHLARNRRSTRRYKKEPVSRADMDKIISSARFAPTGENAQELEYLVIDDPARIAAIREAMAKQFKLLNALVKGLYGFVALAMGKKEAQRSRASLARIVAKWAEGKEAGEDPFLRTAPTLLIIHSKQKTFMAQTDAGIAGYHVMLAAETLGIGTVWNGFHQTFCKINGGMRKVSLVPKGHNVLASICLGYPAVKYKRNVHRRPVRSRFVGTGES
ncbi:MAG: nitroreductase family protein [Candidatus Lokiarchaeota archaeon]|nr:nitroreductase family protein [Candidatus Lokiarchaeota archaeon]